MRTSSLCGIASAALTGFLLPFISGMVFSGCSPPPEEFSAPPHPEARVGDLVIALLPERNVFEQKKKYRPLQDYLSKKLGITVYFRLLDNYQRIFEERQQGTVDGGFFGSMNGTIAQLRGAVQILVRPQWRDGHSTYRGYILTHTNLRGDITEDPRTWRGRRIAFVNKVTTAGYLYPLSLMRGSGSTEDIDDYFERVIFTGSHDGVVTALLQREVDLGACKNTVYDEIMLLHPDVAGKLTILSTSPDVPSNALGVRPDLSDFLKERIRSVLIGMNADPEGETVLKEFGALGFIETSLDDYRPVIKMTEKAGIDLSQWPLRRVKDDRPYR